MLVLVIDDDRPACRVDGLRMQADIARGADLVYSVEGVVSLGGRHYRLQASLGPYGEPSDEEEPGP